MGGIFGGGGDPPPMNVYVPPPPPPPPKEEIMDVFDRVRGVQAIVVTGPDGKKRREITQLPRTPEDEALYQRGMDLMSRAIRNIDELYQYRPESVVPIQSFIDSVANLNEEMQRDLNEIANFGDIQRYVNDYKVMNQNILDQYINRENRRTEENFAHRGISDSTSANEYRAAFSKEAALARLQNNVNADLYAQDLADRKFASNAAAFSLREQGRQNRLQEIQNTYNLQQQNVNDLENVRRRAIEDNYRMFGVGASLRGEDINKALASQAPEIQDRTFSMISGDNLNRYQAQVNAQNSAVQNQISAYNAQLAAYNSRPPSFGDRLLQLGGMAAGAMMGSPASSLAGRAGNALFGRFL